MPEQTHTARRHSLMQPTVQHFLERLILEPTRCVSRMIRWLCLMGMLGLLLTGCSRSVDHPEIRFAVAQMPLNLDPRYATDAASERVNRLIYRPLVDFDAHARPVPALASWQQRDALHYRFTLGSQERTFHDGTTLQAADVVATYRSLLTLHDAPHAAEFANIVDIEAVDQDTVDFTLAKADAQFPARMIIGILPERLIRQEHDFAHAPVGSGPLRFTSWHHTLTLERIADHQAIVLEEVRDPTVRALKLLRGEADLLQGDLPPELVGYLQKQTGVKVLTSPGTNFSYLGFNLQDPQLQNPAVRHAVAMAIDRDALIQHALVAGSRSATAILPPEHWAGNPELVPVAYDPVRARKMLEDAGVKLPLKLTLKTSTDAQRVRLATVMQAQLAKAGIALEIRSLDWGTFFDDVKHGKFQLYGLTWVGIKTPEIYRLAFHSEAVPPAGANRGHLHDPALDALIDRQDWKSATARIDALMPYVPLWYEGQFAVLRQDIQGYAPAPDGNWDALASVRKTH
jgi:peptide/nickel transport system substrate-binding protein